MMGAESEKNKRIDRIAFGILQFKEDFRNHPGSPKSPRITVMNRFSSFLVYLKEKTLNVTNFKFQRKLLISF